MVICSNVGRKTRIIIAVIVMLAALFIIGIAIKDIIKSANYVRTEATVINTINHDGYWVTYSFDVNGTTYSAKRQEIGIIRKIAGNKANIRYDPNNPERLENKALQQTGIAFGLFYAMFSAILFLSLRKNKFETSNIN